MDQINELISQLRFDGEFQSFNREQWLLVINHVISELGVLIEEEIKPDKKDFEDIKKGFCIGVETRPRLGPLGLYLRGTIGADLYDDGKQIRISSTLVMIGEQDRLLLSSQGEMRQFIEFEFQNMEDHWQWISRGWQIDIYGEYDGY